VNQTTAVPEFARDETEPGSSALPAPVGALVAVVASTLKRALERARDLDGSDYTTVCLEMSHSIVDEVFAANPEAVLVDTTPDASQLIQAIAWSRAATKAPIIAVGCQGTLQEMMRCYEFGADDYASPHAPHSEIDLRMRAMFRRLRNSNTCNHQGSSQTLHIGEIAIDQASHEVRKANVAVALSPTEFRLLATLAERAGEVVPAKALIARVWGSEYASETHYLRLYIRYLRQKLEEDPSHPTYIVNRWGSGYALVAPHAS
jgi:two-component system, OmpR family, KDP operon response regulator KdpE